MAFDQRTFRQVMGAYPTGVTIVSAADGRGQLHGMAANSFTSVSLDPPMILVCAQTGARTSEAAKASGRFAVHVLAHAQGSVVRAFVGRDAPRFAAVDHELDEHGTPLLSDWLALLVCRLDRVVEAGDHEVLLGEVERCEHRPHAPLVFHESALRPLAYASATERPVMLDDELDLSGPLVRVLAPLEPAGT